MIHRILSEKLIQWSREYPVVTVTGPRQSGKTTLCKALFPEKPYISLEESSLRLQAREDPRGFLARFPDGAILDEIQRAPELPSYIQTIVDSRDSPGMYILTGSQQFELMAGVSQSLAGRTAIARLLPLSYPELYAQGPAPDLSTMLYTGFYPRIHDRNLDPSEAMSFYFSTYVERDLRQILQVRDLASFERFMRLLAGRNGQILNASGIAADCGISHGTVKGWLSVLQQSALVYLLGPYYRNQGKRLVKSPKVYFLDTGLLCWLLNIYSPAQLDSHPLRGSIFEAYVVAEFLKSLYNRGKPDTLLYFRDQKGHEVDLLSEAQQGLLLCEIKSSATFHPDFLAGMRYFETVYAQPVSKRLVLGSTDAPYTFKDSLVVGYPMAGDLP